MSHCKLTFCLTSRLCSRRAPGRQVQGGAAEVVTVGMEDYTVPVAEVVGVGLLLRGTRTAARAAMAPKDSAL